MPRLFCLLGALLGLLSVALGAFGAHGLKAILPDGLLGTFETGARYQMYHALALVMVGWIGRTARDPWLSWAGWSFVAGIVLFSGSLYLLSLTGTRWLGAVTPLGGLAFMAGWAMFAIGLWKEQRRARSEER